MGEEDFWGLKNGFWSLAFGFVRLGLGFHHGFMFVISGGQIYDGAATGSVGDLERTKRRGD